MHQILRYGLRTKGTNPSELLDKRWGVSSPLKPQMDQKKFVVFLRERKQGAGQHHRETNEDSMEKVGTLAPAAVTMANLPGSRLFHEGQFEGRNFRAPVFCGRRPQEQSNHELQSFCVQLPASPRKSKISRNSTPSHPK